MCGIFIIEMQFNSHRVTSHCPKKNCLKYVFTATDENNCDLDSMGRANLAATKSCQKTSTLLDVHFMSTQKSNLYTALTSHTQDTTVHFIGYWSLVLTVCLHPAPLVPGSELFSWVDNWHSSTYEKCSLRKGCRCHTVKWNVGHLLHRNTKVWCRTTPEQVTTLWTNYITLWANYNIMNKWWLLLLLLLLGTNYNITMSKLLWTNHNVIMSTFWYHYEQSMALLWANYDMSKSSW